MNISLLKNYKTHLSLWDRIPERVVHAKGSGAYSIFTMTRTEYALSFQKITDRLDFHNI
ncbi:MAG: catalase [Nostoc indistinguendum CM1-VF10]|nr:catalase [Nostoc indistinguendum CM1-VF10]